MVTQARSAAKAIIILQGRVRSTRLPGKGFFHFFDQTMWERMCDIALSCNFADKVIFATGDINENFLVEDLVKNKGVEFFFGSEDDVFQRFADVAKLFPSEYIVRITCDNYLVQPELLEDLFTLVDCQKADYGYIEPLSHYCGEVIRSSLITSAREVTDMSKEHVTWDIRRSSLVKKIKLPADYKGVDHSRAVTLDDIDDFILMKTLESSLASLNNVRCLDSLRSINQHITSFKQGFTPTLDVNYKL